MSLTKVTYSMIDGAYTNVQDFGAVGDGVADDTTAIQAAINASPNTPLFFPAGSYKITNTLYPTTRTKFIGEPGATGAFESFVTKFLYTPPTAIKTTLSAGIDSIVTTIPLTNAASFPTSGIIYLDSVNGEYIKYTGKSGNNLTGCTRGYYGGTVGATAYLTGEDVWLLQPFMFRDTTFSGTIQNIDIVNVAFNQSTLNFEDQGVCLYLTYAAYGTILRDSCIQGFEKALYCGRAFVTTLEHPMIYWCAYGAQFDVANGVVINAPDSGRIGRATAPVIAGYVFYFYGGSGASIFGGNLGNGSYNVPIVSNACYGVTANGIYVEAHAIDLVHALNNGIVYINGAYLKDTTYVGRTFTDGQIHINGISHENSNFNYIVNSDNTGSWSIKNKYNLNTGLDESDQYGIGTARYEVPYFTQSTSPILAAEQRGVKAIPDNTATAIFKIRTLANSTQQDTQVGLTVDYFLAGGWDTGAVSQKGLLEIAIHHRWTIAPVTAITKVGETTATVSTSTRTTTFTATSTLIATNTYETTIEVTSVASNAAASTLTYVVKPSNYNLVSNLNQGFLTIL